MNRTKKTETKTAVKAPKLAKGRKKQPKPELNWYALYCESGKEESIRRDVTRKVKIEGLEDYVGKIVLPRQAVTEYRGGKATTIRRKATPGYLLVLMCHTPDTHYLFSETDGVIWFLPNNESPAVIDAEELRKLLPDEVETTPTSSYHLPYSVGSEVKIIDGTWKGFRATVLDIDEELGQEPTVKIKVSVMGREVEVSVPCLLVRPAK